MKNNANEYLDKLKAYGDSVKNVLMRGMVDTVFTVQTTVRDVLPGNPLNRDYEILEKIGSAGTKRLWTLYKAVRKSTKQEACVFVLEKAQLDRYGKRLKELMLERLRRSVQLLARLKHPRILSVEHQLEESRNSVAFASEPVWGSLGDLMDKNSELTDVEIRYGARQIADALSFLQKEARVVHNGICPSTVLVSAHSMLWKLACFEFSVQSVSVCSKKFPVQVYTDEDFNGISSPNLCYTAPELIANTTQEDTVYAADLYSLALLIYALYNGGRALFTSESSCCERVLQKMKTLSPSKMNILPMAPIDQKTRLINTLLHLLRFDARHRPTLDEFIKSDFFDNIYVRTLELIDSLFQVDEHQRSVFYKSLPSIMEALPLKILVYRVIAAFELEFVNPNMIPFILPNIFQILKKCDSHPSYVALVLESVKKVLNMKKQMTSETIFIILQNMRYLVQKCNADDIRNTIVPMVKNALDSQAAHIQELCIDTLPTFEKSLDSNQMRTIILPRLKKICLDPSSILSTKVKSLICIGNLVTSLDKWMIVDDILPILQSITCREPAVIMTILGITKTIMNQSKYNLPIEALANKVIPLLLSLSIENSLKIEQFDAFMIVIRNILSVVENDRRKKLSQIADIEVNTRAAMVTEAIEKGCQKANQPVQVRRDSAQAMIDRIMNEFDSPSKQLTRSSTNQINIGTLKPTEILNNTAQKTPQTLNKSAQDELSDLFG